MRLVELILALQDASIGRGETARSAIRSVSQVLRSLNWPACQVKTTVSAANEADRDGTVDSKWPLKGHRTPISD
jgi:hypothetical protein